MSQPRSFSIFSSCGVTAQLGPSTPNCWIFQTPHNQTLTQKVGLLWVSDQLDAEAATYTTHETNIHALNRIRTRDPSNQAAADLRLRKHGQRYGL